MIKKIRQHATIKSVLGIVVMLVLFSAFVMVLGFRSFTDNIMDQYSDGAFQTAKSAAEIVDADRIDAYMQSGGTGEEYQQVWDGLDYLCNVSGSTFIYVILPDRSDYAHITFVFSTINSESEYTPYEFGYVRDTTNDEYKEKYAALYDLKSERELVVRDRGYIETDPHITAMVGLKGSDGQVKGILCVQRQMDVLAKARQRYLTGVILTLAGLALFFAVAQVLFMKKMLLNPLKQISDEATRFAAENVPAQSKLKDTIRNTDEVGQLAASIDLMEEQVKDYVDNLMSVTAEKERIDTELNLASRIQTNVIPNIYPAFPDRDEFDIYATMTPAKEIGGDFYDFFFVGENRLAIVIADVCGKGVPAALFMMVSKILIQNIALIGHEPKDVLRLVNRQLCKNNSEDMFVTVWIGMLDLDTGKLVAANAGHEYPVVKHGEGAFELIKDKHGLMLGWGEFAEYTEYELQINPGDELFVYTDGVPEATNADEQLFGTERMMEALNSVRGDSPQNVLESVREAVDAFVGEAPQFDDLTMLCLQYRGSDVPPRS